MKAGQRHYGHLHEACFHAVCIAVCFNPCSSVCSAPQVCRPRIAIHHQPTLIQILLFAPALGLLGLDLIVNCLRLDSCSGNHLLVWITCIPAKAAQTLSCIFLMKSFAAHAANCTDQNVFVHPKQAIGLAFCPTVAPQHCGLWLPVAALHRQAELTSHRKSILSKCIWRKPM